MRARAGGEVIVMNRSRALSRLLTVAIATLLGLGSCFAEPNGLGPTATGGTDALSEGGASAGGAAGSGPVCTARAPKRDAKCNPATSGEPLLVRQVSDTPQDTQVFVDDLYARFANYCGSCHVQNSLGAFHVTRNTFSTDVDDKALKAIESDTQTCKKDSSGNKLDASCFDWMPPTGKSWSDRQKDPSDPVVGFATLLDTWIQQGRPVDIFTLPADKGGKSPYSINLGFSKMWTNIGTCVPDEGMVATELTQSCALDDRFAAMARKPDGTPQEQIGLPNTLEQTDLFSFDSARLATYGVIAYVPAYPLWSDSAAKLRYVRVPRGQSIKYDSKTKQFDIPKNTRFYKTFFRKVIDFDGVER